MPKVAEVRMTALNLNLSSLTPGPFHCFPDHRSGVCSFEKTGKTGKKVKGKSLLR